jgi:hypothetical protein
MGKLLQLEKVPDGRMHVHRVSPTMLSDGHIHTIASLRHFRWSEKDGGLPKEHYERQLDKMRKDGATPVFVLEKDGKIVGFLRTLRWEGDLPNLYSLLEDCSRGSTLVCSNISVEPNMPGGARMLIREGAARYFMEMKDFGKLDRLVAYSRPSHFAHYANMLEEKNLTITDYLKCTHSTHNIDGEQESFEMQLHAYDRYIQKHGPLLLKDYLAITHRHSADQNIGMHLKFGAEITEVFPNACPSDYAAGRYNITMDYWPSAMAEKPSAGIDRHFTLV